MECAVSTSDLGTALPCQSPRREQLRGAKLQQNVRSEREQQRTIRILRPWPSNKKIVGFDIAIDEILVVYRLDACDLEKRKCKAYT
jgi:hypothetical protein